MSASNYAPCLKVILANEGGYANNPRDPGGETNYGITKATARANGYTGSMHSIPMSVVEKIYRTKFWQSPQGNCDDLPAGVDLVVFDYAVNSGPGRAWAAYAPCKGLSAADAIKTICAARLAFLKHLGTWSTFGGGWSKRVAHVQALALAMAAAPAAPVETPKAPAPTPATPAPLPTPKPPAAPAKPVEAPKEAPKLDPKHAAGGIGAILAAFAHSWQLAAVVAVVVVAGICVIGYLNQKK